MELAFLLIVLLSAGAGVASRRAVSRTLGRVLLGLGIGSLVSAVGVASLMAFSKGRVIGFWSGSMILLALVILTGLFLPFGVAVSWRRS